MKVILFDLHWWDITGSYQQLQADAINALNHSILIRTRLTSHPCLLAESSPWWTGCSVLEGILLRVSCGMLMWWSRCYNDVSEPRTDGTAGGDWSAWRWSADVLRRGRQVYLVSERRHVSSLSDQGSLIDLLFYRRANFSSHLNILVSFYSRRSLTSKVPRDSEPSAKLPSDTRTFIKFPPFLIL